MSNEKQLTTRPNSQYGQANVRPLTRGEIQEVAKRQAEVTTKDIYKVSGQQGAGAKIVSVAAVDHNVELVVLEVRKNFEEAYAAVKAIRVDEHGKRIERTRVVIHNFAQILKLAVIDAIEKGLWVSSWNESTRKMDRRRIEVPWEIVDGAPIITNAQAQFQIYQTHLRKQVFAERDALTKAERNATLAVLGMPEETKDPKEEAKELQDWIRATILEASDDSADLAKSMMSDVTAALGDRGVPHVSSPARLTDLTHLRLVKEHLQQLQEGKADDEEASGDKALEIEPEDDPTAA